MPREKTPDHVALLLVLDAGEELFAEPDDCRGLVEGKAFVHFPAGEMARLAALLEDRAHIGLETRRRGRSPDVRVEEHEIDDQALEHEHRVAPATLQDMAFL